MKMAKAVQRLTPVLRNLQGSVAVSSQATTVRHQSTETPTKTYGPLKDQDRIFPISMGVMTGGSREPWPEASGTRLRRLWRKDLTGLSMRSKLLG